MGNPSLFNLTSASCLFFLGFCFFFFGSFYDFFGGELNSFCTFFSFLRILVSPVRRPDVKSSSPSTLDRMR
jgi:hypothetical protein